MGLSRFSKLLSCLGGYTYQEIGGIVVSKSLMDEICFETRLFRAAGEGSALESIALKAAFTLCSLVLQKPSRNFKGRNHTSCLEKRMKLWHDGDLNALVLED